DVPWNAVRGVELQHPEIDLHEALVRRDRQSRLLRAVKANQRVEVEVGEKVSIHDQERALQSGHGGQRPRGSRRLVLVDVVERNAVGQLLPVMEVRLHQLCEMAHRQSDIPDAEAHEPLDEDFQHRLIAERHKWLRKVECERLETRTLAAGKYDGSQSCGFAAW